MRLYLVVAEAYMGRCDDGMLKVCLGIFDNQKAVDAAITNYVNVCIKYYAKRYNLNEKDIDDISRFDIISKYCSYETIEIELNKEYPLSIPEEIKHEKWDELLEDGIELGWYMRGK